MRQEGRSGRLFDADPDLPPGFRLEDAFLRDEERSALEVAVAALEYVTVMMRGVPARRRTAHYGVTYAYDSRSGAPGRPIPAFLLGVRARLAAWAGIAADDFAEALVTEYRPGAGIGWHRDAPMFGDVIAGLSLGAEARMRFRPYVRPSSRPAAAPRRHATHEVTLVPGSAYLMAGVARREYEHSIPPVDRRRYSVTFRTLRTRAAR